jgi:leucyl/phenylalanyl-tRNA--protein transferase
VALNQLVAFDTVNMSWTNIGSFLWEGPRPLPLFGHGAVAIDHRLLIFGGTTGGVPDSLASYLFGRGFVTGYAAGARNDLVVMDLQARTFSMPKYAGRRPPPAYRHTVSTRKGKIFVFGGVGGDGHMSLLDTGHAPGEVASTGVLKKAPSTLDAAAAGLFAAEMGAEFGRTDGRGLDATRASQLVSLLQELDMNKYTRLFLRQEVDVDSLLTLSDADRAEYLRLCPEADVSTVPNGADTDFFQPRPGQEGTWIIPGMLPAYLEFHRQGYAHSIECWRDETLVGGLYGVTLGGAFFGESMFSRERDASKIALVHLVARLRRGGWRRLDTQFLTGHLSQFGAVETPQAAYLKLLRAARPLRPNTRSLFDPMTGSEALFYALQPTIQAS